MFRRVDCLLLRIPDLEAGLRFYRDRLGLSPAWRRGDESAGLKMGNGETELVLVQEQGTPETDLLVDSVDASCREFVEAGGRVVLEPFDIPVGRCAKVKDPWGNELVILDLSKGRLQVDSTGQVVG